MVAPYSVGQDGLERVGVISDKTCALCTFNWLKTAKLLVIRRFYARGKDL
jgi:hypothetical protein